MAGRLDLVSIVEAAYAVDRAAIPWLEGTLAAVQPALDRGLGVSAFFYDASDVEHLSLRSFIGGNAEGDRIVRSIEASPPERVRWTFRTHACRTASAGPNWENQPAAKLFRSLGFEDVLFLNGLDPSGIGCFFTSKLRKRARLDRREVSAWSRVAAHLGSGYRLQRRLAHARVAPSHGAVAIFEPSGKIAHAEPAAKSRATHDVLRHAVIATERARGRMRRASPEDAIEEWKPLVGAKWTLLDHFERGGRRYVVAQVNTPDVAPSASLTPRELQALAFAEMGHTNKLIAYELGISASTVGVLLWRAARKLRATSRAALIESYARTRR